MSDDSSAASSSTTEHDGVGVRSCLKSKFKILTLVDGILVEPLASHDGDEGDDDTATDEESAMEQLSIDESVHPFAGKKSDFVTWSCPGESSDGRTCSTPGKDPRCTHSLYGTKVESTSELEQKIGPDVDGGLVFTVKILPNNYNSKGEQKLKFLQTKDYNPKSGTPKARRKMPFPVTSDDFYSSLSRIGKPSIEVHGEEGYDEIWDRDARRTSLHKIMKDNSAPSPRWIFTGVINGWPGLPMPLEVLKIQGRDPSFIGRRRGWSTLWGRETDGKVDGKDPSYCKNSSEEKGLQVKVKLRAPEWSAHGWSPTSPGFIFWVEGQRVGAKSNPPLSVTYGTDLISHFKCPDEEDPMSTRVHMISHRYATGGRSESQKQKLTYHSIILLEWSHRQYCTVVEIGYLNGLGGYKCKSNWYADKDAPESSLYAAYPPELIMPWKETMSEIRVHDVPYPGKSTIPW